MNRAARPTFPAHIFENRSFNVKLVKHLGLAALLLLGTGLVLIDWSKETASPAERVDRVARIAGGLWVSGPHRHKNLEVYLVHGPDQLPNGERILTLEEAIQQKQAIVHETGEVERLAIESLAPDAEVFVQAGDIVRGGKQDRVLAVDLLVSKKSGRTDVASFCVEEGRWSVRGSAGGSCELEIGEESAGVMDADVVESAFASSQHALPTPALKRAVRVAGDQARVWQGVRQCQERLRWMLGHEDVIPEESESSLELTMGGARVQGAAGDYLQALSDVLDGKQDVLGAVFAVNGKVTSGDIYGSRELFRKLWPKLLRASAVEAMAAVAAVAAVATDEAVGCENVAELLVGAVERRVTTEDLSDRVQLARSEGPGDHFFETRDRDRNLAWIHRSYLAK